tara:strand:- start:3076 stop:4146 length:1071 start_codon:yes stop_codon:yes gene_type:complete
MHVLKQFDDSKGILIITHKEYLFFCKLLKNIKIKYNIIVHYGFNVPIKNNPNISFNLLPNSRCYNNICLPFTSRNFLNKCFNNKESIDIINKKLVEILKKYNIEFNLKENEKNFDFIYCGRAVDIKKTYELLRYTINYIKLNPNTTACFIILKQNKDNSYYNSIINFWNNNKINNILFIDTHVLNIINNYFLGFTSKELSYFYKSSKIYIHGCENEGESRSIHEALCCGCKILAKKNMKGGGLDYLNNNNSILYENSETLKKMDMILNSYSYYNYDNKLFEELNEEFTIDKFLNILYNNLNYKNIYLYDDFKNRVNVDNLAFSLPGHNLSVPWYIKGTLTSDIKTQEQLNILQKYI